ncbi:MAG: F0F1 ATP synthase subunit gamma [Hyphomicrobiaceae bacterium]|nr:F0F1 ATP synthase subunit gamma [Hyphomicrobiaceae bacterium]
MASLKELRNRIASVKATQKITKAMQMVAAAKLRRAQEAAEAGRPYANRMDRVMASLGAKVGMDEGAPRLLAGTGKSDVHLLLVATAERGLCGGFNSNIAKLATKDISKLLAKGKQVKILCVGRKGYDVLKRDHASRMVEGSPIDFKSIKRIGFTQAEQVGRKILSMFDEGEFDVCTLYYSEFKTVVEQIPTAQPLIPVKIGDETGEPGANGAIGAEAAYEYEPGEAEILDDLLPRNVMTQIFRALQENAASEQGARMSSMDNATRNAGDMIDRLTLEYNRSRQAQITSELIEIISGAEAV